MHRGFVPMWRKSISSRVFQNSDLWKVWCWCLIKANHEDNWVPVSTGRGETEVHVKEGQFIFGRKKAAKALKMKSTSVYYRLQKLRDMRNIDIQPDTHYSIITVCKWENYKIYQYYLQQAPRQATDNQLTTKRQPSDTEKNVKNVKNYKKISTEGPELSISLENPVDNVDSVDNSVLSDACKYFNCQNGAFIDTVSEAIEKLGDDRVRATMRDTADRKQAGNSNAVGYFLTLLREMMGEKR